MNKYIKFLAIGSLILLSSSCADDEIFEKITPAADGSEVVFGARAGFENGNPDSRTEYSGQTYTIKQEDGTEIKFERINWTVGDKIEIYCPQASSLKNSHYIVTRETTGDNIESDKDKDEDSHLNDFATLARIGDSSIQWNGDGQHDFYAMYPSSMIFTDDPEKTLETGVFLDDKTVNGIVPQTQYPESIVPTTIDGKVHYEAKPDMDHAYMIAKSEGDRKNTPNVGLSFIPIVTAVKINLTLPTTATKNFSIAEVKVGGNGIAGSFTANLDGWNGDGYVQCSKNAEKPSYDEILIPVWQKDSQGNYVPHAIAPGASFSFTVFLLPTADLSSLSVYVSDGSAGYQEKKLSGKNNSIIIPAHKKTIINGLNLPVEFEVDASKWMEDVADDTPIGKLSIPGTGGSFSYNYNSSNKTWYQQQTLDFEKQWKLGIRAFEIISDRYKGEPDNNSDGNNDFGDVYVKCNNTSVSITIDAVMDKLVSHLNTHVDECAALIFTYQPEGDTTHPRNGAQYITDLCEYLKNNYKDYYIKYSPNLTMEAVRGKILLIARPTQLDEDSDDAISAATAAAADMNDQLLVVEGCGTGKDKWGRRGYYVNEAPAPDIVPYSASLRAEFPDTSVEGYTVQYWTGLTSKAWRDYASNVTRDPNSVDFGYDVSLSDGESYKIWFQEWARVAFEYGQYGGGWTSVAYRWYESYNEKLENAKDCFSRAIKDTKGDYVYVNSLCGYKVDSNIANSYTAFGSNKSDGGTAGNIKALADKLNNDFYNHVVFVGIDKKTGPIGILMMDYVSENEEDGGSYFLPGVIIKNNFKSTLK